MRPPIDMRLNPAKDIADSLEGSVFKDRGNLLVDFEREAEKQGETKDEALRLFRALPNDLRAVPTMTSPVDGKRRYFYGGIYDLDAVPGFVGTEQFPEVATLYAAVSFFQRLGDPKAWKEWIGKIGTTEKHAAALAETEPPLRVNQGIPIAYEVPGASSNKGASNKTIDWGFSAPDSRRILVDVKFRDCDLIDFFKQINAGVPEHLTTPPDPSLLFRDTVEKFLPSAPSISLQGAWITSGVALDESQFQAAFTKLDASRFHFAIFPLGLDEAYVVARREEDVDFLLKFFHFSFTRRIFREPPLGTAHLGASAPP